jgi:glyoxylase-like metal-dependent hydrolase (beta-lactamase superfamily II)
MVACLTVAAGLAVLLGYWRLRSSGSQARTSDPGLRALDVPVLGRLPVEVSDGIYLLGGMDPAAVYVVQTPEGLILIDSGVEADATTLKRQMARLGLDWRRVKAILLTHAHVDHSAGADYLRQATGARLYAGWRDAAVLRAGKPREAFFSTFPFPPDIPAPHVSVDVELKGDQVIDIGGVRFQALDMPGHTLGSICYLMERNHLRVLFSGDVIQSLVGHEQSPSRLARPLGTYAAYLSPRYRGDAGAFLASLRKLRALPVPDLVLPGHPRMDPFPPNPVLSQERWGAMLDRGIQDMEKLLARYQSDGALFLDGKAKQLLPGLYYLGEFGGRAGYGLISASRFFLIDAPGRPGWTDALKARFQQLGVQPPPLAGVLLTACDPEAIAGLNELIAKSHALVIAPPAGLERIRVSCPPGTRVESAEELPLFGWFEVKPLPLRGRGLAPVAYQIRWTNKTVLFSGRIPIKPPNRQAQLELFQEFSAKKGSRVDFAASIDELGKLRPDLWLPAAPVDDQNAELYDGDWEDVLQYNRNLPR